MFLRLFKMFKGRSSTFNPENGSLFQEYISQHARFLKAADQSITYSFDDIFELLKNNDKVLWDRIGKLKETYKDLYNSIVD